MKKIENEELKKTQYDILLYIKEICEKNNISYFIGYGTLLGAVRHGGFIPWDDDIDVILLREEYEKFVQIMKKEKHDYYRFCDMRNMERCHLPYGIMEDTRTGVYHERFAPDLMRNEGVSVDIFPFDDLPNERSEIEKIVRHQKFWKALNNLRITIKFPESDSIIKKILKCLGKLSVLIIGKRCIYSNVNKIVNKQFEKKGEMVGDLMCNPGLHTCFPKEIFSESIDMLFENDYFKAPKDYKKFLEICYGDYMTLPPKEKQKGQHEYIYFWRENEKK